jgi:hypothetical protein
MSVCFYQSVWRLTPEDSKLHANRRGNCRPHILALYFLLTDPQAINGEAEKGEDQQQSEWTQKAAPGRKHEQDGGT